jgi:hypothetical protein
VATKIKCQFFDWGKSRRVPVEFFADVRLDPVRVSQGGARGRIQCEEGVSYRTLALSI